MQLTVFVIFIQIDFVRVDDDVNGGGESQQKMIQIDDNWELRVFHYFAISEYMIGLL